MIEAEPLAGPTTYVYDADNLRVRKTSDTDDTLFIWDGQKVLQETDDTGDVTAEYTSTTEEYGNLTSEFGSEAAFPLPDAQGSVVARADSSQNIDDTYVYRAFGEPVDHTGASDSPFTYLGVVGYYQDPETGFNQVRERNYDPPTHQWTSRDPAPAPGEENNLYEYSGNNAVNRSDPSGAQPLPDPYSLPSLPRRDRDDARPVREPPKLTLPSFTSPPLPNPFDAPDVPRLPIDDTPLQRPDKADDEESLPDPGILEFPIEIPEVRDDAKDADTSILSPLPPVFDLPEPPQLAGQPLGDEEIVTLEIQLKAIIGDDDSRKLLNKIITEVLLIYGRNRNKVNRAEEGKPLPTRSELTEGRGAALALSIYIHSMAEMLKEKHAERIHPHYNPVNATYESTREIASTALRVIEMDKRLIEEIIPFYDEALQTTEGQVDARTEDIEDFLAWLKRTNATYGPRQGASAAIGRPGAEMKLGTNIRVYKIDRAYIQAFKDKTFGIAINQTVYPNYGDEASASVIRDDLEPGTLDPMEKSAMPRGSLRKERTVEDPSYYKHLRDVEEEGKTTGQKSGMGFRNLQEQKKLHGRIGKAGKGAKVAKTLAKPSATFNTIEIEAHEETGANWFRIVVDGRPLVRETVVVPVNDFDKLDRVYKFIGAEEIIRVWLGYTGEVKSSYEQRR